MRHTLRIRAKAFMEQPLQEYLHGGIHSALVIDGALHVFLIQEGQLLGVLAIPHEECVHSGKRQSNSHHAMSRRHANLSPQGILGIVDEKALALREGPHVHGAKLKCHVPFHAEEKMDVVWLHIQRARRFIVAHCHADDSDSLIEIEKITGGTLWGISGVG